MPAPDRSIAGKVALVTGAGSGMGRAIVELFVAEGGAGAALDRDAAGLGETAARVAAGPGRVLTAVCDVADPAALRDAVGTARRELGPVDILVNNAGVSLPTEIGGDDFERMWEQTLAVNLTAQARTVRACLDDLVRDGQGRVVNIASTEGLGATAFISPYTASKHGVIGLTRALAVELAPRGVTVNAVCPGPIRTGMTAGIPEEHKQKFARRRVPMRRYGEPVEVAHMVLSLVLPGASYVTGAVVAVDGGLTVQNT